MSTLSPATKQRYKARARDAARTRRIVAERLRERLRAHDADAVYVKAKEVAAETEFTPRQVGAALRTLDETQVPVAAETWTSSTPTTWEVTGDE